MTNLFDATIQHQGWAAPDFANGGWVDVVNPIANGLVAQSYWAQSLNGNVIDQAAGFDHQANPNAPLFFNVHSNGVLQGATTPGGYLVQPTSRLWIYTRVPVSSQAILFRVVVSDLGTTPAPSTPP